MTWEYGRSIRGNTAFPIVEGENYARRPIDESWKVWPLLREGIRDEKNGRPSVGRASNAYCVWNHIWAHSNKPRARDVSARGLMWVDLDELEEVTGHTSGKWLAAKRALADLDRLHLIVYQHVHKERGVVFFPALHVVAFNSDRAPEPYELTAKDDLAPVRAYLGFMAVRDTSWEEFSAAHHATGYAPFSRRGMSKRTDQEWELISWLAHMRKVLGLSAGPRCSILECDDDAHREELRDEMWPWIYGVALDQIEKGDVLHWDTLLAYKFDDKGRELVEWEPSWSADELQFCKKKQRHYVRFEVEEKIMRLPVRPQDVHLFTGEAA